MDTAVSTQDYKVKDIGLADEGRKEINISEPEIHTSQVQQALTREMETLAAANVDDQGVVFPVQQFVVVATR